MRTGDALCPAYLSSSHVCQIAEGKVQSAAANAEDGCTDHGDLDRSNNSHADVLQIQTPSDVMEHNLTLCVE